jgi:hypothetical protein
MRCLSADMAYPWASGADLNLAVIPEDQAVRVRDLDRRRDLDIMADQRRLDSPYP